MAIDPSRSAGDPQRRVAGTHTAQLFEEHGRMVYGLCCALLRDPDDADDATQSTFISAYKSLLGGRDVLEPAAWLATIARNECSARAHARMREPLPLLDADLGQIQGPEAELERRAAVEDLQQAISGLPEKQREAVVLRDLYGLQYTEVSAALGMSVASVESLLFRARRSLRVSLKPLASGALLVPVAVREGVAQALPGFMTAGVAGGGAASGAVGLGLLAKFTGVPLALKIAAGVLAVTATGSMTVIGAEQAAKQHRTSMPADAQPQVAAASALTADGSLRVSAFDRYGTRSAVDDGGPDHARPGDRDRGEDRPAPRGPTTGGSGHEESADGGSEIRGGHKKSGPAGSRSNADSGARRANRFGRAETTSGSGDATPPENGDNLPGTDASGSDSGGSGGSGSSGDSGSEGSSGSSVDGSATTTPPPE